MKEPTRTTFQLQPQTIPLAGTTSALTVLQMLSMQVLLSRLVSGPALKWQLTGLFLHLFSSGYLSSRCMW